MHKKGLKLDLLSDTFWLIMVGKAQMLLERFTFHLLATVQNCWTLEALVMAKFHSQFQGHGFVHAKLQSERHGLLRHENKTEPFLSLTLTPVLLLLRQNIS